MKAGSSESTAADSGVMNFLRGGGQDAADPGAALLRPPDEIQAFIGRDAAADNQKDRLSLHACSLLGLPRS